MKEKIFKRSTIHNLIISSSKNNNFDDGIVEGLVIPMDILKKSDIFPYEQIIVTRIDGGNWNNRIKTFAVPGKEKGFVEARGSLAKFFKKGDLTCVITQTFLDESEFKKYKKEEYFTFDLGYDPLNNDKNLSPSCLNIERVNRKSLNVKDYNSYAKIRAKFRRVMLSSLILNLKINNTHPDCLQGSAELPANLMKKSEIERYQSVSVYNSSKGGIADTYAVPMPDGVVMTTGAMATFAKIGEVVNVATYTVTDKRLFPKIITTDGKRFKRRLMVR